MGCTEAETELAGGRASGATEGRGLSGAGASAGVGACVAAEKTAGGTRDAVGEGMGTGARGDTGESDGAEARAVTGLAGEGIGSEAGTFGSDITDSRGTTEADWAFVGTVGSARGP